MTDVHSKATRSKNMRAIGTRDTAIEKRLSGLLTQAGFEFRVQDAALAGRPDFVLDRCSASSSPTAVSGIITTVICSKCLPRALNSGWQKSVKTSSVTGAMSPR